MRLLSLALCWLFIVSVGCKASYMPSPKKTAMVRAAVMPNEIQVDKAMNGIDFTASGSIVRPWTLDIDLEKGFFFQDGSGMRIIASAVAPVKEEHADVYVVKTDSGTMKISIFEAPCKPAPGKHQPVKCEVMLGAQTYGGCGNWLYNFRLNDIWVLEYIENEEIDVRKYQKQLPTLEFNLLEDKMIGSDGCSTISANISVHGNHLEFSPFADRRLRCPGNAAERIFAAALSNRIVDFDITATRLTLFLFDDSKLVFRKME